MSWNLCGNSIILNFEIESERELEYHKWFNYYYDEALSLVVLSDNNFNDSALSVVIETLNNDCGDLETMLNDDSMISETAANVIRECIEPYISECWVSHLYNKLENAIIWHIKQHFAFNCK